MLLGASCLLMQLPQVSELAGHTFQCSQLAFQDLLQDMVEHHVCYPVLSSCLFAVAHGPFAQGGNTLVWYSIAGMLSASFGASMLPIAKFAWEKLEFLLAPSQEREKQQQVYPCSARC